MSKKNLSPRPIMQIILYAGILLFIIPLLLTWIVLILYSFSLVKETVINSQKQLLDMENSIIEKDLTQIVSDMNAISNDKNVQNILKNTNFESYDSKLYNDYTYLDKTISRIIQSNRKLYPVILINNEGKVYSNQFTPEDSKNNLTDMLWYKQTILMHGKINVTSPMTISTGENVLSLAKLIIDSNDLRFIGVIHVACSQSYLADAILSGQKNNSNPTYLVNPSGDILFNFYGSNELGIQYMIHDFIRSSKDEPAFEQKVNNNRTIFIFSDKNKYGMRMVTLINFSSITKQLLSAQLSNALLIALCLILFANILIFFYWQFSIPIRRILSALNATSHGFEAIGVNDKIIYKCYELNQINDGFISLIRKGRDGNDEIVKLIHQCEVTTLDKLQAQVNPHFLYNTLTSIKSIAVLSGQQELSRLITSLVKLLQNAIGKGGAFITLENEIENLQHYISIENVIYCGNFMMQMNIPNELLMCMIPNFILQPLVENCIFHGINPNEKGGEIIITVAQESDLLIIDVIDNGKGFDSVDVDQLLQKEHTYNMSLTNFGIPGVQKKIKLLCGNEFGITINNLETKGSMVRIELPMVYAEIRETEH